MPGYCDAKGKGPEGAKCFKALLSPGGERGGVPLIGPTELQWNRSEPTQCSRIYNYGGSNLLEYTGYRSGSSIMFVQCGIWKRWKMQTRLGALADSSVAAQQCTVIIKPYQTLVGSAWSSMMKIRWCWSWMGRDANVQRLKRKRSTVEARQPPEGAFV